MIIKITLIIAFFFTFAVPTAYYLWGTKRKNRLKQSLKLNIALFFCFLFISEFILFGTKIYASPINSQPVTIGAGLGYLAAALSVGISGLGGGLAVGSAAKAALNILDDDDNIFGKALIFVGLAEGIALYGLIIAFMILGKL